MYSLHDVRVNICFSVAVAFIVAVPAERSKVADYVLTLAPPVDVVNIYGIFTAYLAGNNIINAEAEMPEVNLYVWCHSFARNFLNSSSIAAIIRSLVALSGYSTWITSP